MGASQVNQEGFSSNKPDPYDETFRKDSSNINLLSVIVLSANCDVSLLSSSFIAVASISCISCHTDPSKRYILPVSRAILVSPSLALVGKSSVVSTGSFQFNFAESTTLSKALSITFSTTLL